MHQPTPFGAWLRQQRITLGFSQEALATRIGYSGDTIRKIETGERHPAHEVVMRLAEYLEVPAHERAAFAQFARGLDAADPSVGRGARDPHAPWRRPLRPPTNLPNPLTRLLGRTRERELLGQQLRADTRLLTLTGPPGVGKTRLALQVASDLRDDFCQGVFFVRLAPVADPGLLPATMVSALGIPPSPGQPFTDLLANYLRDKQLLLLLDNCEHLLAGIPVITELLQQCAALRVLATSREPLRLYGEQRVAVSPLALPSAEQLPRLSPAELLDYAAVALFVERAHAVQVDFTLDPANVPAVVGICQQLDGLPLAIELAAAQVSTLPPLTILARLESRLGLLVEGTRDAPDRHQTLQNAIAWSYALLSLDERALFRRLGVFAGGALGEAVLAVGAGVAEGGAITMARVDRLVSKHLLEVSTAGGAVVRYGMLETLREYALAQLTASGEAATIRQRHLAYFLGLAEAAAPQILGPGQLGWMARLETEHDNLWAALDWAQTHDAEAGLRLANALGEFWRRRGHWAEGHGWLAAFLARPTTAIPLRAQALAVDSGLVAMLGDLDLARRLIEESLALYRQLGDRLGMAGALRDLANLTVGQGNLGQAFMLATESLTLAQAAGDPGAIAAALFRLGHVVSGQGEFAQARAYFLECLAIFREVGDRRPIAMTINNLGLVAAYLGDEVEAQHRYEEGLALWRELDDRGGMVATLSNLGSLALTQGAARRAQALFEEALAFQRELGGQVGIGGMLGALGDVARAQGDYGTARQYYEQSLQILRKWSPDDADEILRSLGLLALDEDDPQQAEPLLRESLTLCPGWNQPYHLAPALAGMGVVTGAGRQPERAARLFGAARAILERSGARFTPWDAVLLARYEAQVRAALDPTAWEAAYTAGLSMTIEEARACALDESPMDRA